MFYVKPNIWNNALLNSVSLDFSELISLVMNLLS